MAWTRVQGVAPADSGASSASSVSCTLGAAVGSGSDVLGMVSWDSTGVTLSSVTDDKGNTYALEATVTNVADGQNYAAYSRTNITNAPITITANFSAGVDFRAVTAEEFSGGSTASTDERDGHTGQYQGTPGTGTDAVTSGNITTSVNGDLIWSGVGSRAADSSPAIGTSFTNGSGMQNNLRINTEYRTQSTAGSVAGTWTQSPTPGGVSTFVIALKPSGGVAAKTPYNPWPQAAPVVAQ